MVSFLPSTHEAQPLAASIASARWPWIQLLPKPRQIIFVTSLFPSVTSDNFSVTGEFCSVTELIDQPGGFGKWNNNPLYREKRRSKGFYPVNELRKYQYFLLAGYAFCVTKCSPACRRCGKVGFHPPKGSPVSASLKGPAL